MNICHAPWIRYIVDKVVFVGRTKSLGVPKGLFLYHIAVSLHHSNHIASTIASLHKWYRSAHALLSYAHVVSCIINWLTRMATLSHVAITPHSPAAHATRRQSTCHTRHACPYNTSTTYAPCHAHHTPIRRRHSHMTTLRPKRLSHMVPVRIYN